MMTLYKADIPGMSLLYYLEVPGGFLSWTKQDGQRHTSWESLEEIREYIEGPHRGKLRPSSKLEFLVVTGMVIDVGTKQ